MIEDKGIVEIKHLLPFVKLERAYLPMWGKGKWVGEGICVFFGGYELGSRALLCFARWQMSWKHWVAVFFSVKMDEGGLNGWKWIKAIEMDRYGRLYMKVHLV